MPRYSSLRYDKVNGRAGPSLDYPVTWTYERLGLPVVIVRESQEWRKIRDPQGDEVWVHRRMLAADRTAITTAAGAIKRDADSRSRCRRPLQYRRGAAAGGLHARPGARSRPRAGKASC